MAAFLAALKGAQGAQEAQGAKGAIGSGSQFAGSSADAGAVQAPAQGAIGSGSQFSTAPGPQSNGISDHTMSAGHPRPDTGALPYGDSAPVQFDWSRYLYDPTMGQV